MDDSQIPPITPQARQPRRGFSSKMLLLSSMAAMAHLNSSRTVASPTPTLDALGEMLEFEARRSKGRPIVVVDDTGIPAYAPRGKQVDDPSQYLDLKVTVFGTEGKRARRRAAARAKAAKKQP